MFPCTMCGECCKRVDQAHETKWLDRADGVCRYFNESENLCSIYLKRPEICRIDQMYESFFSKVMTKSKFYQLNADSCNIMQLQSGISEFYRVKLENLEAVKKSEAVKGTKKGSS